MKRLILLSLSCLFAWAMPSALSAQNLMEEMTFPGTLRSEGDTLYLTSPGWGEVIKEYITREDTINWGTYGHEGVTMTVWTDVDTLTIHHVNYPNRQFVRIPVASLQDTTVCIIRFQSSSSAYSDDYVQASEKVRFEIPEAYELANIILYLTNCSELTYNHPNTDYTERVEAHFGAFRHHRLIRTLNKLCEGDYWQVYYGFRENGVCFRFEGDRLLYDTPYKHVYYDQSGVSGGHFRNLLYLIQGFAKESGFREFYRENQAYYEGLELRQSQLLPLEQMWDWLEKEFPQRMNAYKVVFSPLIGGSHSTQNFFRGELFDPFFREAVMYINSPEAIDQSDQYAEVLKEGLMSGIVFTEIDHNYVNPTSQNYMEQIKALIDDKDFWATAAAQQNYSSEYSIFNEYMTHSLFCLYVIEHYEEAVASQVIERRIRLMERRGYPKFALFNNKLVELMTDRQRTVFDAYGELIEAMATLK